LVGKNGNVVDCSEELLYDRREINDGIARFRLYRERNIEKI
jgi:hypothetical protein